MSEQQPITVAEYRRLMEANDELKKQLALYEAKVPLVGVRWYGDGGNSIGLTNPINGVSRIYLSGYGDKGVIDISTWVRMRGSVEAKDGILVRDDNVVDELAMTGVKGKEETTKNPNAWTDEEIESVLRLKNSLPSVKKIMNNITHYFPAKHFRRVAENSGVGDVETLTYIKDVEKEKFHKHNISLLHHHDLTQACEIRKIPGFDVLTDEEMVKEIVKYDMERGM